MVDGLGFTCPYWLMKPGWEAQQIKSQQPFLTVGTKYGSRNTVWIAWTMSYPEPVSKLIMGSENTDTACCVRWMMIEKLLIPGIYLSGWYIFTSSGFIFLYRNYEWIGAYVCVLSVRMSADHIYEFAEQLSSLKQYT